MSNLSEHFAPSRSRTSDSRFYGREALSGSLCKLLLPDLKEIGYARLLLASANNQHFVSFFITENFRQGNDLAELESLRLFQLKILKELAANFV